MAKRRKNKNMGRARKSKSFAKTLPRTRITPITSNYSKITLATIIDDRRRWNPQKKHVRPRLLYSGQLAPTQTKVLDKPHRRLYEKTTYIVPKQTAVCVRRQTRKEVLFATGKAGKRLGTRKSRRNPQSYISCKR